MSVIDDAARLLVEITEQLGTNPIAVAELIDQGEDPEAIIATMLDEATPVDDLAGFLVDTVEEFVLADLTQAGELTPDNVEGVNDAAEGNAVLALTSVIALAGFIETISAGQIDETTGQITQALAGLGIDDVTGAELTARYQEGVLPALEAKMAKEHVPQFVALQDAHEFALRQKESDTGYLHGSTAPEETVDKVGSVDPVNPENLLEEWGIRPDQLPILEEVGMNIPEIEELVESPVQFGVVPTEQETNDVIDRSGLPESTKDLFRRTMQQAPRSADLWEQRTTGDELVTQLDELVMAGEISPADAVGFLPGELEEAYPALEDRWELLAAVPEKAPTRSQIEASFTAGLTDLATFQQRLARVDIDPGEYPDVVDEVILGDIDGGLQEAFAVGRITEGQYGDLMDRVNLPAEAQETLISGGDLSDVTEKRLTDQADPASQPVASIPGVGSSRAAGLRAVGIETVADLAGADVAVVTEAAQVSVIQAVTFINTARTRTGQDPLQPPQEAREAVGFQLEDLATINDAEAALLRQEGLADIQAVAESTPEELAFILGIGEQTAREIIAQATQETS